MDMYVGDKIKELRLHYNIYQEELAEGICTQATISRIEKNETIPNSYILYQIAKRLGVDMAYFYGSGSLLKIEYVKNVYDDLERLVRARNYKEVLRIVKLEKSNPLFHRNELKQILLWREGISVFYLYRDTEKAFELFYGALKLTPTTKKNSSAIEIDILASIAAIHGEVGQLEKADEIYQEIFLKMKKLPTNYDPKIAIRITYNSAVNAHFLSNYQEAISFCDKTIQLCLTHSTFYTLGETYFQKGESILALTNNKNEALVWFEKSLALFKMVNNEAAGNYVLEEIRKLGSTSLA
uniref:HTH cro/C1-type domain-containing protein n=2 Tax=Anaerobacillus isosaccharinicus TaxID=1532552 RepID=A0A1S2MEC1_9BACI|nr:helix-turn-helix domain-containing protein [Anaerobacillus isosaccharinicus]QOY38007.1 helix-turn-helix domain-containing protein [Anaerobacillus isosaccharinicus]